MDTLTCSFLGLGLIGGSIARAFRGKFPDMKIKVYDCDIPSLSLALRERVATNIYTEITTDLCDADFIFLCAPVGSNNELLRTILPLLNDHAVITDVGSVKTPIHALVKELSLSHRFIGGHPMAGSERFGYANSKPGLLENAYYVITPTDEVPSEKVEQLKQLVAATKAIPLIISCEEHDHATAAISHLPHIIASSLVNLVKDSDSDDGLMKTMAAGGFKDITRIASSNPSMWQQICLTNTANIKELLDAYIADLQGISETLLKKNGVELYNFFDSARIYRDSFSDLSRGPIKRSFTVNIEIPDKAGTLAHVTALLAEENINIKNINITHNRESEYGALKIEFYKEADQLRAVELLQRNDFTTYLRRL
ncbi:MAG: prephenate dehydrogenase [Lachnospiraceae bacterium]|nr:prephenate dehydrogenase [Lachnospiraceae bacterium]